MVNKYTIVWFFLTKILNELLLLNVKHKKIDHKFCTYEYGTNDDSL